MRYAFVIIVAAACRMPADLATTPVTLLSPRGVRLERVPCSSGHELAAPVSIHGTIGWFVIDSGAFTHAVYSSFAKRATLALAPDADIVGGGGGIPVKTLADPTLEVLGVARVSPREVIVLDEASTPLAQRTCGVAGVIAPSLLATQDEAVLVDFPARRLARIPVTDIDRTLLAARGDRFDVADGGHAYGFTIDATIGVVPTRLLVDTGACCTWVTTAGTVGRALVARSTPGGDTIQSLQSVRPYRHVATGLAFGAVKRTTDLHIIDGDSGDAVDDGALGSDALADCIVVFAEHSLHGACRRQR